jgi:hypothetical protein
MNPTLAIGLKINLPISFFTSTATQSVKKRKCASIYFSDQEESIYFYCNTNDMFDLPQNKYHNILKNLSRHSVAQIQISSAKTKKQK